MTGDRRFAGNSSAPSRCTRGRRLQLGRNPLLSPALALRLTTALATGDRHCWLVGTAASRSRQIARRHVLPVSISGKSAARWRGVRLGAGGVLEERALQLGRDPLLVLRFPSASTTASRNPAISSCTAPARGQGTAASRCRVNSRRAAHQLPVDFGKRPERSRGVPRRGRRAPRHGRVAGLAVGKRQGRPEFHRLSSAGT